jgi:hypothetical protein
MWKLPNGKFIQHAMPVQIDGISYPAEIFVKWNKAKLAKIGVKPVVHHMINPEVYTVTDKIEEEIDGEIHLKYQTKKRFTLAEMRALTETRLMNNYLQNLRTARNILRYYEAIEDQQMVKETNDYIVDLAVQVKGFRDKIYTEKDHETLASISWTWTTRPGGLQYA